MRAAFTVSVNVNAGAFGLLQQVVEIFQIVTGDQNALAFSRFDVDLSRRWVTVFGEHRHQNMSL